MLLGLVQHDTLHIDQQAKRNFGMGMKRKKVLLESILNVIFYFSLVIPKIVVQNRVKPCCVSLQRIASQPVSSVMSLECVPCI